MQERWEAVSNSILHEFSFDIEFDTASQGMLI